MELADVFDAAENSVPIAEGVEDEAPGALAAALERRGAMQAVAHDARSRR